eukprot:9474605-Pyramimonas_sp.AAC.1
MHACCARRDGATHMCGHPFPMCESGSRHVGKKRNARQSSTVCGRGRRANDVRACWVIKFASAS